MLSAGYTSVKYAKLTTLVCIGACVLLAFFAVIRSLTKPTPRAEARPAVAAPIKPTPQSNRSTGQAPADFAKGVESQLLRRGMDARVSLEGRDQDVLRIEWHGMRGPIVYDLVNSPMLRDGAKPFGIKTILFADGGGLRDCGDLAKARCEERWDYNVERESMIWWPSSL